MAKRRAIYAACFGILLLIEICIALFVRDAFIRPYGGDVLVTILLCCGVRMFLPQKIRLLPLWVFLFAAAVEFSQMIPLVELIGLGDVMFLRVVMGESFPGWDLVCYGTGCALFSGAEILAKKAKSTVSTRK